MARLPGLSEVGSLRRVVLKHAQDALVGPHDIAAQWQVAGLAAAPDFDIAVAEFDAFAAMLARSGVDIFWLPRDDRTGIDSLFVRDASNLVPDGLVFSAPGPRRRADEADAQRTALVVAGVQVAGHIDPPGTIEGSDVVWLDSGTVVVGRSERTNDEGIAAFVRFAGPDVQCVSVPLPADPRTQRTWRLTSIFSPVDHELAVVCPSLLPAELRALLDDRRVRLVEVPEDEAARLGANVLALAPGRCLVVDGNPVARRQMEAAGVEVIAYAGAEISLKTGRGPTCLTRPLVRDAI